MSSQKDPDLHAVDRESGPHFRSRPSLSTVTTVGLFFSRASPVLPPSVFALLDWFGVLFPWLTLRGLYTDRLEAFAADHRLAFRGLPAEGPGITPTMPPLRPFFPIAPPGCLDRRDGRASPWQYPGHGVPFYF